MRFWRFPFYCMGVCKIWIISYQNSRQKIPIILFICTILIMFSEYLVSCSYLVLRFRRRYFILRISKMDEWNRSWSIQTMYHKERLLLFYNSKLLGGGSSVGIFKPLASKVGNHHRFHTAALKSWLEVHPNHSLAAMRFLHLPKLPFPWNFSEIISCKSSYLFPLIMLPWYPSLRLLTVLRISLPLPMHLRTSAFVHCLSMIFWGSFYTLTFQTLQSF